MRRRPLTRAAALAVAASALLPAAGAHAATLANWDKRDQATVMRADVLPKQAGGFHGERGLSAGQLEHALAAVAARTGAEPVTVPAGARISVATFDRIVVKQIGLADLADSVQHEAARAGLAPPSRFGTEVVARQLGLRFNHPAQDDALELYPDDVITRAEAAYSFARVLSFGYEPDYARQVLDQFALPRYSPAQKRALRVAVSKIGMPYVWGGESDSTSSVYGAQAHGGYDCSGFAWRVFKLSGNPAGAKIGGRTAAQMAGEIPRRARVPFDQIRGGDLLFFGSASFHSKATEGNIVHMGIALSGKFMIHSSSEGVYVSPLFEDWRRAEFAWARRVL